MPHLSSSWRFPGSSEVLVIICKVYFGALQCLFPINHTPVHSTPFGNPCLSQQLHWRFQLLVWHPSKSRAIAYQTGLFGCPDM